jgi:AcrR family transcriptional regulator
LSQTLKPEVRAAILDAARDRFAAAGYRDAKMSDIAAAAGVSTGNLYRYFADREALFTAAVPPELAERLLALVAQRVGSLAATPALADPDPGAREDGERFLAFLLAHRRETIVLLDGAAGSVFEAVRARFVDRLVDPLREQTRDPVAALLLHVVFDNTVHALVALLRSSDDEATLRRAFHGFWSYQLPGLAGLLRWMSP